MDNRNADVVVVCSVADYSKPFLIIRLNKEASGTIELLKLNDTRTDIIGGSVIDLEMDIDGNVMYALEDENGRQCCGFTKYII